MDYFNTGIDQISIDDVDRMEFYELCEYLSMNGIDTKGTKSELVDKFKKFLENVPVDESTLKDSSMPSFPFDYKYEIIKLRDVVQKIKNQNDQPTDMILLEEMAEDMTSRMPIFMPKYPGFHNYDELDLNAQDYIQYLPNDFKHEKYAAIWTTPNGRKCPLF